MGVAQVKLGDAAAERTLREVTVAHPQQARAHLALGMWLSKQGRDADAVPVLQQARAVSPPGDLDAGLALAVALQQVGRPADAKPLYEELRRLHPRDTRLPYNQALLALRLGRNAEALAHLRAFFEMGPDDPDMRRFAKRLYRKLEAEAKASRPTEAVR